MSGPTVSDNVFERNPKKTMGLVIILTIALVDFIAGWVAIPNDLHDFRTSHPYYHHGLLSLQYSQTQWGPINYQVYTSSLGFRDFGKREIPLASNQYRVVLMGDSHTEAVGVKFEESFAGRLHSAMDSLGVQILNAGVVSYSPKLYYLKTKYLLEKVGLQFDALFVFIDISDIQNEFAYEKFEPKNKNWITISVDNINLFLRRRSFIYYGLKKYYQDSQRTAFYNAISNNQIKHNNTVDIYHDFFSDFDDKLLMSNPEFHTTLTEWYSDKSLYERWGKKGVSLMTHHMKQLVKLCKEHNIDLTISVHPWRRNVQKGNSEDPHVSYWRRFANEHHTEFINFYPVFINGKNADSVIQRNFHLKDNHWNGAGHNKIFKKLREFVSPQNLSTDSANYFYQKGLKAFELNKFDVAIAAFNLALVVNPEHAKSYLWRGLSYRGQGQFDLAEFDLRLAYNMNADLSMAEKEIRNFSAQKQIFQLSKAINEEVVDTLILERGKTFLDLGNYDQAYDDFLAANRMNTLLKEPYFYLGLMEHRQFHNPGGANKYLNRAIQIDPNYVDAYLERIAVFRALGNESSAEVDLKKIEVIKLAIPDSRSADSISIE